MTESERIIKLKDESFEEFLEKAELPIFIDCWAEWCRPCLAAAPIVDQLEKDYRSKMIFAKVNVENNEEIANRFKVMSIPFFTIIYKGEQLKEMIGVRKKEKFVELIEAALKEIEKE